jgi:ABC-type Fe3+ transport system substrate-binding protein
VNRLLLIFALAVVVGLPFVLRPEREAAGRTDDTLVAITPHNEAIRHEFARGFAAWYREKTGRTVAIDWRIVGGTSDIARFLEGEYTTAFENHWTGRLGRKWSSEIQAGFQAARLAPDASAVVKEAREAFRASDVGCGIDLFFGGGTYDFDRQAAAGRLVDSGIVTRRPEWFREEILPRRVAGEDYRHADGLWIGTVLSAYGIIYNREALQRLGIEQEPTQWTDLADPRLVGEVALADPTKSGSVAKAFENIIQQQMQRRLQALQAEHPTGDAAAIETRAVREGWLDGLRLVQRIGANARYFTDTSQKPPIDVAAGNCAAGLCIDFYGRQQQEAVRRRASERTGHGGGAANERIGYVTPRGGSVASVDPVALLRGAPHREVAVAFIEYVLSAEGQKLWNYRPGTPGGPERFALRRMPVRKDFYAEPGSRELRSDPDESPFEVADPLVYRDAWTGRYFREMALIVRIMCQDTHLELRRAWRTVLAAPEPARTKALAALQDLSAVDYPAVTSTIRARLGARDKVEEVRLAKELGDFFRKNYARAEAIARGGE